MTTTKAPLNVRIRFGPARPLVGEELARDTVVYIAVCYRETRFHCFITRGRRLMMSAPVASLQRRRTLSVFGANVITLMVFSCPFAIDNAPWALPINTLFLFAYFLVDVNSLPSCFVYHYFSSPLSSPFLPNKINTNRWLRLIIYAWCIFGWVI